MAILRNTDSDQQRVPIPEPCWTARTQLARYPWSSCWAISISYNAPRIWELAHHSRSGSRPIGQSGGEGSAPRHREPERDNGNKRMFEDTDVADSNLTRNKRPISITSR